MTDRVDNFNRADSTTSLGTPSDAGSAWVVQSGTWGIISNTGYDNTVGSQNTAVLETSVSNGYVQCTAPAVGRNGGLVIRAVDDANYILGVFDVTPSLKLYRRVANTFTQLGSTYSGAVTNGDVFKLSADSSNALVWAQNGTTRCSATDSSGSTNTKMGLRVTLDGANGERFDSFSTVADTAGLSIPVAMHQYRRLRAA